MKQIVHLSLRQESIKGSSVSKNMTEQKWGGSQFFLPMSGEGHNFFVSVQGEGQNFLGVFFKKLVALPLSK